MKYSRIVVLAGVLTGVIACQAYGVNYQLTVISGSGSGSYPAATVVSLIADAAPSGKVFNMWAGDPDGFDSWDEMKAASATYVMPARNQTLIATYRLPNSPVDWWPYFNEFCKQTFGAEKEPLAYDMNGSELTFLDRSGSEWTYASQTSASVFMETNLPAKTYVEYGKTPSYGSQATIETDRYYYLHLAHLTGLDQDTTYHYRYVAQDERGNIVCSDDRTVTTATPANVIYVPAQVSGPPYNLTQANKTYLLTQDLVCNRIAFDVQADNVTLDLGGHTVVYDNEDYQVSSDFTHTSSIGVRVLTHNNVKVVNGTINQGDGCNDSDTDGLGYNPMLMQQGSGEVAGVSMEYIGGSLKGIGLFYPAGTWSVHHNAILDRGGEIADRNAGAPYGVRYATNPHHNLVKRVRQNGISGNNNDSVYANEVYVDSCATNAFDISLYAMHNEEVYWNRAFGTGYLVVGYSATGTIHDLDIHDNYAHLQAVRADTRWGEYGAQSGAYCFRITSYGFSQPIDNVNYHDNYGITYGRDGGEDGMGGMVRGVWITASRVVTNCSFSNNVLKAVLTTLDTYTQGCIVHVGDQGTDCVPIIYADNVLISNFCNARMGEDYYGAGQNAEFYNNTFLRVGPDRPDYRTIGVGYGSLRSSGHKFYDSVFGPGTGYDHVRWDGSGTRNFYVGWTLTVQTEPNAGISVKDSTNAVVWTGVADASGLASKELYQYYARPTGNTFYTPHQVTASLGGDNRTVSVTLDAKKTVQVYLYTHTLTVNSGSGGGAYYPGTVVAIAANAPASGSAFDAWVGNTAGVADVHAASTTLTMPDSAAVITATYTQPQYLLTVNSGSGDGTYVAGTVVAISADAAASGTVFDRWTGDTADVANVLAASTTVTMPAANVAVTATYKLSSHSLTVNSGSGSGTYDPGAVVAIVADAPDTGLRFLAWTGDTAGVADVLAAGTTITMPAADAAITATYTLRGDLNGDRFVGQGDLNIVLAQWGRGLPGNPPITDPRADANNDNSVGQGDLNIVLGDWGDSAP